MGTHTIITEFSIREAALQQLRNTVPARPHCVYGFSLLSLTVVAKHFLFFITALSYFHCW